MGNALRWSQWAHLLIVNKSFALSSVKVHGRQVISPNLFSLTSDNIECLEGNDPSKTRDSDLSLIQLAIGNHSDDSGTYLNHSVSDSKLFERYGKLLFCCWAGAKNKVVNMGYYCLGHQSKL